MRCICTALYNYSVYYSSCILIPLIDREALLKAGVDPDKALAEKKFSLSEEIDKIYRKKEKSCRTSSRTARTADSEFENSYLTKDESFLPEISTAQRENYFGDQARLAFFDYYRQLSRQMNSLKPGKYSDSDLSNLLAIEKSRRSDVLMSPSAKSRRASLLALEDEKVGRSICRKSTRDSEDISDGFKANIETLGATVDEKDLFLNHLIADGSDASSLKVADQRPFSARSKFLLGCVNKGLLPQPSLIIRKDYNSILNISFLGIGDEMAKILADSLETLPLLEGLYIADNKLTDAGLVPIIKSLYKCPRLKCLDLSQNKIDILAANALSDYLSSASCSIHQLILKKADVDDIECCQFVLVGQLM